MKAIFLLFSVQGRVLLNGLRRPTWGRFLKTLFLSLVSLLFLLFIYGIFWKLFSYFQSVSILGPILVFRFLSMVLFGFLCMLLFSNIVTSLSVAFLSLELPLLWALPLKPIHIFISRFFRTLLSSSWMVVIMSIPIFLALGTVYKASFGFYLAAPVLFLLFVLIGGGVGMTLTLLLMRFFPAQRVRDLFLLLGIIFVCALAIFFRYLEPEKLANPSAAMEYLEFIDQIGVPTAPYLPSAWVTEGVNAVIGSDTPGFFKYAGYLALTAFAVIGICLGLSNKYYYEGWCHAQESLGVKRSSRKFIRKWPNSSIFSSALRSLFIKDLKVLFRDTTQWSQLLILLSLVVIYLFNLYKLPLDIFKDLKQILFFLNMGFMGFILAAVAARLVFPSVSLEGKNYWILRSAPLSDKTLLKEKLLIGGAPLLLLSIVLIICSIYFLKIDRYMAAVALFTVVSLTFGIISLAVGLGAFFARFDINNPEEAVTSLGGVVYMVFAVFYIALVLAIEAYPVRIHYFSKLVISYHPDLWLTLWLPLIFLGIVHGVTYWLPLKFGLKRLAGMEI